MSSKTFRPAGGTHSTSSTRRGNQVLSCGGTLNATRSKASTSAGNCLYAAPESHQTPQLSLCRPGHNQDEPGAACHACAVQSGAAQRSATSAMASWASPAPLTRETGAVNARQVQQVRQRRAVDVRRPPVHNGTHEAGRATWTGSMRAM